MPLLRNTFDVKWKGAGLAVVLILLIGFMTTGCVSRQPARQGQTVDSRAFVEFKRGIPLAELESIFQIKPAHEFTVRRNGETIRCVQYVLVRPAIQQSYYFVFVNDGLNLVCLLPPFKYETHIENGSRLSCQITGRPEERIEAVLQSKDLSDEALAESVFRAISYKRPKKTSDDWNVVPAFIIVAPFIIACAPVTVVQNLQWRHKVEAQRTKLNPFKIELGMTVGEVEAMFGTPFTVGTTTDNLEVRYYGLPEFWAHSQAWVSVVFDQGKAVRVLSDDFFDSETIRNMVRQKSAKH